MDRLFSVGDLVDRGPESEQVLDWLDKPWFHAILGNHDFMAFRSALGTPAAVDYLQSWGLWLDRLPEPEQRRVGEALAALPLALEVETTAGIVGLVHADCPFDDCHDMLDVQWDGIDLTGWIADCCLWSIERYTQHYASPVSNVRAVVHGHMVVRTPEVLGNVHFIDTGGWKPGGNFTFLELFGQVVVGGAIHLEYCTSIQYRHGTRFRPCPAAAARRISSASSCAAWDSATTAPTSWLACSAG